MIGFYYTKEGKKFFTPSYKWAQWAHRNRKNKFENHPIFLYKIDLPE